MVNMNIVPNDFVSVAKLFVRIISHTKKTTQNQASHVLNKEKQVKCYLCFKVMFHMFHDFVA